MLKSRVLRGIVIGAVTIAVVAAGGFWAASALTTTSDRYVTALASTGDVTASYTATGSVTRKNSVAASFSVSGTVKKVYVSVGDTVTEGETLAVLNKSALQLAVLEAETTVAQAKAALYSARHPSSSSSSSSSGGSSGGVTVNAKVLNAAVSRVNAAVTDESAKCDALIASLKSSSSSSSSSTSSSSTSSASTEATPSASASTTSLTKTDVSDADLQACADARAELTAANQNLTKVVAAMTKSGGATKKSSSSSTKVSKSAVATAKATLLKANQALATAQTNLSNAELVAPISGTVGLVGLTAGSSSSSGTITIVGAGVAKVTFELPLAQREKVKVGQTVTVNPAGSSKELSGRITAISPLETSGTSGDTPTYSTTVTVSDSKNLLASGSKASVAIAIASASGVVRLPASAVTPTGTNTATVSVVTAANAKTAADETVKTGVVGGGWVEITEGITAGQMVVLADRTAAIPSNTTTSRRTTSSSSSSSKSTSSAAPVAAASSTASTAPQPAASASK